MLAQRINQASPNGPFVGDLGAYQQLVDLQKQMIKLAQQNERVRQECAKLREQVTVAATAPPNPRRNLRQRAGKTLRKIPGAATLKSGLVSLIVKQPSAC